MTTLEIKVFGAVPCYATSNSGPDSTLGHRDRKMGAHPTTHQFAEATFDQLYKGGLSRTFLHDRLFLRWQATEPKLDGCPMIAAAHSCLTDIQEQETQGRCGEGFPSANEVRLTGKQKNTLHHLSRFASI